MDELSSPVYLTKETDVNEQEKAAILAVLKSLSWSIAALRPGEGWDRDPAEREIEKLEKLWREEASD